MKNTLGPGIGLGPLGGQPSLLRSAPEGRGAIAAERDIALDGIHLENPPGPWHASLLALPPVDTPRATILVAAAILVEEGRVLLSQRKKGAHLEGLWEFPGGKVEPGEDPRDALVRELDEELGICVTVGDIVEATFHRYEEAGRSVLLLFYEVSRTPGSSEPSARDVADLAWVGPEGLLPERFPPADIDVLAKVRARLVWPEG